MTHHLEHAEMFQTHTKNISLYFLIEKNQTPPAYIYLLMSAHDLAHPAAVSVPEVLSC